MIPTHKRNCRTATVYELPHASIGPTDVGVKKDFVPRVTLGTILNQQNLELL